MSEELSRYHRGAAMSSSTEIAKGSSTPSKRIKPGTMMKDFFGRRAEESFTYKDTRNKFFDWEDETTGSSYSSYFMRREKNPLANAAKMLGSMFRVIGIDKSMTYTSKADLTDTNTVRVPIGMLKTESGEYKTEDANVLDAFYGASIQNAALAAYQTKAEYKKTLQKSKDAGKLHDLFFSIINTERVDKKLSERLPGYLKFVQKFKDYTFDEHYEPVGEDASAQVRLMDLIARMMRYPANLKESELEEFKEPLQAVERLLKKHGGIPNSTDACSGMAQSLSNIVYKYVDKDEEEEKPEGGGGEGDSNPDMGKDEVDEAASSMMKSMMKGGAGAGSDEDDAAFKEFEEDMEEKSHPSRMPEDFTETGKAEGGEKLIWKNATGNRAQYMSDISRIDSTKASVLRTLFERKNKDYQFAIKSMRSGRFDTNKIAEAVQRVPNIYERMGSVTTNKICVGVLIDESGSMYSSDKIQKARQAAVFINEVFGKMSGAELFIYGHTADQSGNRSVDMRVYREPGTRLDKYALGDVQARSNNRDGAAIYETAKRIRKRTENQGLLFVISDGQPAASNYGGREAIEDTKQKVLKAQALGFQVIQIAIEESVPSEKMFQYYIKMTDIKNLPRDMISYMSRKVDKLIRQTVTV